MQMEMYLTPMINSSPAEFVVNYSDRWLIYLTLERRPKPSSSNQLQSIEVYTRIREIRCALSKDN